MPRPDKLDLLDKLKRKEADIVEQCRPQWLAVGRMHCSTAQTYLNSTKYLPLPHPLQVILSKIMPTDIFLCRRNGNPRSIQYSSVVEVLLSGLRTAYASVTGVSATGVVTITGSTMTDGMQVIFTSLTGGSSVSTGVAYYAVNSTGATCKLATTEGGSAIALGSDITAASAIVVNPQMRVWSSEFRDVFTPAGVGLNDGGGATSGSVTSMTGVVVNNPSFAAGAGSVVGITGTPLPANSDEIAHVPLRQTLVNRTFWIFDRGSSIEPRYLYAEYQPGDVIADNAPNQ